MMLCSFVIRNPCWRRSKDLVQIGCGSSECRFAFSSRNCHLACKLQLLFKSWSFYGKAKRWSKVLINSSIVKEWWPWERIFLSILWLSFSPDYISHLSTNSCDKFQKMNGKYILERILDSTKKCRTCSESWNVQSLTCRPRAQFLKLTRFYFSRRCLRDGVRASSVIWENVSNGMKSYGIFVSFCYSSEIKRWGCNGIESVTGIWRVDQHWWQNGLC